MSNGSTGLTVNNAAQRPAPTKPLSSFDRLLTALDKNKNGMIDEFHDVVLTDTNKDGAADKVTLLGTPTVGKIIRFERRGEDEIGNYIRNIAKLDFIFNSDEQKIAEQISKDLGVTLTSAEMINLRTRIDAKTSSILVDVLTKFIVKKMKAVNPQLFKEPNLAVNTN